MMGLWKFAWLHLTVLGSRQNCQKNAIAVEFYCVSSSIISLTTKSMETPKMDNSSEDGGKGEAKFQPRVKILESSSETVEAISKEEAQKLIEEFYSKVADLYIKGVATKEYLKSKIKDEENEHQALEVTLEKIVPTERIHELSLYNDAVMRDKSDELTSTAGEKTILDKDFESYCLTVPQIIKLIEKHSSTLGKEESLSFLTKSNTTENYHEIFSVLATKEGEIYIDTRNKTGEEWNRFASMTDSTKSYIRVYPSNNLK